MDSAEYKSRPNQSNPQNLIATAAAVLLAIATSGCTFASNGGGLELDGSLRAFEAVFDEEGNEGPNGKRYFELSGPEWIRDRNQELVEAYLLYVGFGPRPHDEKAFGELDSVYWIAGDYGMLRRDDPCWGSSDTPSDCDYTSVTWTDEFILPPHGILWPLILQDSPSGSQWRVPYLPEDQTIEHGMEGDAFVISYGENQFVYKDSLSVPDKLIRGDNVMNLESVTMGPQLQQVSSTTAHGGAAMEQFRQHALFPDAHLAHVGMDHSVLDAWEWLKEEEEEVRNAMGGGGCVLQVRAWTYASAGIESPLTRVSSVPLQQANVVILDVYSKHGTGRAWQVTMEDDGVLPTQYDSRKGEQARSDIGCETANSLAWPEHGAADAESLASKIPLSHNNETPSLHWDVQPKRAGPDDPMHRYRLLYAPYWIDPYASVTYRPYSVLVRAADLSLENVLFHPDDFLAFDAEGGE